MKTVILDNGHGDNTSGKRSPDWDHGVLYEYAFNREIVAKIQAILVAAGVSCEVLVPELTDVSIKERVHRANSLYLNKQKNAFLCSIHANAGGGEGYELFTSVGKTKSDSYASIIYEHIKSDFKDWKMRGIKEDDFGILKHTLCPAVLCECGFMDNVSDYQRLNDPEFKNKLAESHAKALIEIANS